MKNIMSIAQAIIVIVVGFLWMEVGAHAALFRNQATMRQIMEDQGGVISGGSEGGVLTLVADRRLSERERGRVEDALQVLIDLQLIKGAGGLADGKKFCILPDISMAKRSVRRLNSDVIGELLETASELDGLLEVHRFEDPECAAYFFDETAEK